MENNLKFSDSTKYGIINISVANLRQQPVFQSELVNQTLLGTIVPVYEEQNDFYFIENWDGYRGWTSKSSILLTDREKADEWKKSKKVIFTGMNGMVTKTTSGEDERVSDLVCCATLKILEELSKFVKVELPDGRVGFVKKELTVDLAVQKTFKPSPEAIIKTSKQFLGLPYLWGGTSSKALDCSGFVQMVFWLLNVPLPRNASQMIKLGSEIEITNDFDALKTGDLLFFGKTVERVTHVSIYLDKKQFIHADGYVQINSLVPGDADYNEYRHQTLLKVKRIL